MANILVNGAALTCSFGTLASTLSVLAVNRVNALQLPAATVMDQAPMVNIMPFGMCTTVTNPQVASATSAAMGTLTPQPCVPVTTAPWLPGSPNVRIGNKMVINNNCQLMCSWGGVITVTNPGQNTVHVP